MKDIVEKYWGSMFRDYVVRDDAQELMIALPEFPEPLMSPRFIRGEGPQEISYHNQVIDQAEDGFYLHVFEKDEHHKEEIHFSQEPLARAIERKGFWDFQQATYPESYPFIKKLLPFLAARGHHHHVYLGTTDKIIASVIIGKTTDINFLFNASVASDFRNLGLMKMLFNSIIARFPQKQSFYWTIHPWLKLNAAASLKYRVLKVPLTPVN